MDPSVVKKKKIAVLGNHDYVRRSKTGELKANGIIPLKERRIEDGDFVATRLAKS